MPSPIDHPLFGKSVPDQWNEDLLTFRRFPHLRAFWHPDRDRLLASPHLPPQHREWVEQWERHTAELARICRNSLVHAALQSDGVYEVSVQVPRRNGVPSASQEEAYRYFTQNEERTCSHLTDALLRYYKFARVHLAGFDDDDYPDDPSVQELGKLVDFDGFTICRCSSHGISPLRLGWDPAWDPEHGLLMALYKDQVIAIGTDDVDSLLDDPKGTLEYASEDAWEGSWGQRQMLESEREALKHFVDGYEAAEDVD